MKKIFLFIMAAFYVAVGINHFIRPGFYLKIMPPQLPFPLALVYISGVCEIFFALLLFPMATRRTGAWLLVLLLIAVFPANIQMAINYRQTNDHHLWIAIVRLPAQLILIWWAWLYTK
jgi:uncharacterized membrane protein